MSKKLDQILIVDLEATCWKGTPPAGEENEIIEIGICVLNVQQLIKEKKESILVVPQRSKVSSFCTELTTLTQSQVEEGVSFQEACRILKKKYGSKERVWASYGDYDRRQFERQCKSFDVGYPFGTRHLNVKTLFALMQKMSYEVGMSVALEKLSLPLEGTHHRGDDDAWNIASILIALFSK